MVKAGESVFRGTQKGSVDAKGRLRLPVIAKRRLMEQYGATKVFVTSLDGIVAKVYPIQEWEQVEALCSRRATEPGQAGRASTKRTLMFMANHFGAEEKVDAQGRLLIPSKLREESDLKGGVKIQWQSNHMLVMSEAVYSAEVEKNKPTAADLEFAADLGL